MKKITAIALSSCVAVSLIVTPQSAHALDLGGLIPGSTPAPKKPTTPAKPKAPAKPQSPTKPTPPSSHEDQQALRIMNQINSYRIKNGRKPLQIDQTLVSGAKKWSKQMGATGNFKHDTKHVAGPYSAENIFKGPEAEEAVKSWINSPGHRANMLDTKSVRQGVGVAKGKDGQWYVTSRFFYDTNTKAKK